MSTHCRPAPHTAVALRFPLDMSHCCRPISTSAAAAAKHQAQQSMHCHICHQASVRILQRCQWPVQQPRARQPSQRRHRRHRHQQRHVPARNGRHRAARCRWSLAEATSAKLVPQSWIVKRAARGDRSLCSVPSSCGAQGARRPCKM